jgi:hypothetical protein
MAEAAAADVAAASLFGADRRLCSADILAPAEVSDSLLAHFFVHLRPIRKFCGH